MIRIIFYIMFFISMLYATQCCDGTISQSTGKGTCSHHGGICSGGVIDNNVKNESKDDTSKCKDNAPIVIQTEEEKAYFPNDPNFKLLYNEEEEDINYETERPILIKSQEKLKNKKSDLSLIDEVDKRNLWVKKITYTNGGNYKVEFYGDDKKYLYHDSSAIRALLLVHAEQKELRKERNKFEFIEDGYESR